MQRTEDHHHTDAEAEDYIRRALALVETIAPPDNLAAAVFTAAVNLYAAKQLFYAQPAAGALDLGALRLPR